MTMTALELARALHVSPKTLRAFLRRTATDHRLGDRWVIDEPLADAARRHFTGRGITASTKREAHG